MSTSVEEIKASLMAAISQGQTTRGHELAQQALTVGLTPPQIFDECIIPTLRKIGDKFERFEIFLPEMMLAAEVVQEINKVLEPVLRQGDSAVKSLARVVIGTMQGDIHDIGKNLVGVMLQVNGFEVTDLGTDVPVSTFLARARDTGADIIAMSSLLTTSMPYMKYLISTLVASGEREMYKVIVGGGPVTREWAHSIGADAYGRDAAEAVRVCKELMKSATKTSAN
ncbi:MAG: corrinoid protein [Chloroflexi bacterium]|nr:corrinoid protein [Chloroflexota bacterium]MCL5074309.1 corrinoid protein [Chloroflexota bacterium]